MLKGKLALARYPIPCPAPPPLDERRSCGVSAYAVAATGGKALFIDGLLSRSSSETCSSLKERLQHSSDIIADIIAGVIAPPLSLQC